MEKPKEKLPIYLLLGYLFLFTVLAFDPVDRATWFAENLTVWILLALMIFFYAKGVCFSNTAYILTSFLLYLHTIGGHYTFSLVPFDWVTDFFGFSRNHFDRVAHFSVGFYAFLIAEWVWERKLITNRFLLFTYPVFAIVSVAVLYELIEWVYAATANPEAGIAYLGSQGDIWDAQKDMLADTLGALLAMGLFFWLRKPKAGVGEKEISC